MFKNISPTLMVADVNATVKYYVDNFGMEFERGVPDGTEEVVSEVGTKKLKWAMVQRNNIQIMFQTSDSFMVELPMMKDMKMGATLTLNIDVEDIAETFEMMKDKVEVVKPVYKTFYGSEEFIVKDLNGYIIYFSESK